METVDDIKEADEKVKIIFKFIWSDRDSVTNQIHIEFNKYITAFKCQTFEEFLSMLAIILS